MFWWRIGAAAALLITGVVLTTWYTTTPTPEATAANGNGAKDFGIADIPGRATALYPGASGTRWIRIDNSENFPVLVQSVSATVGNPVDANGKKVTTCPASSVRVDDLAAPLTIPRNSTADVPLTTHMLATAPNACRNLTFPLTYHGTATKP